MILPIIYIYNDVLDWFSNDVLALVFHLMCYMISLFQLDFKKAIPTGHVKISIAVLPRECRPFPLLVLNW